MGRFTATDSPAVDAIVVDAVDRIGKAIDAMSIPRLAGVVLGGGYGRGEGGVIEGCRPSNDLDFFAITEDGASAAEIAAIATALEPLSKEWTAKIGIDVDFTVRTPWRIKHDEERLMIQELVRGYFDVAGKSGETLFAAIRRIDASEVPWMEAARLMMNRGMGLMLANGERGTGNGERGTGNGERGTGFINRNINKCVLGAGDARLVARHGYRWRAMERADALGDALYRSAVEWKFRPKDRPVCDWEAARACWMEAYDDVMEAGRSAGALARSLREGVRWIVRRRSPGALSGFGRNCTVRVLDGVARCVRGRIAPDASLMRDWEIFN
ncbi:MAG: hypothetical protein IKO72_11460 [Kiritimatiellae bacterium]|nr:hypothetical protein [Kiritimatiellia bacterium]